jgi:hypothetical protein
MSKWLFATCNAVTATNMLAPKDFASDTFTYAPADVPAPPISP